MTVGHLSGLAAALGRRTHALVVATLAGALVVACSGTQTARRDATAPAVDGRLFTRLPASYTGVDFANRVEDTGEQNVFTYRNHYNGGGVGIGDLTGDGLPELVLTSNQGGARLYLNEGKFRFRDVTDAAGMRGSGAWTTGVTFADVNGDGRLDVYVSHAGMEPGKRRANELWLNEGVDEGGVPRLREAAARFGLADTSYTTQAVFFDSDRDGDLDLFLLNNSPKPVTSFGTRNTRHVRDPLGGDKLYRNDGGRFVDVSAQAGIHGSESGFGLGVVVADVNRDGAPDLYVANDYYERDYLYLNRGDGTFDEQLERQLSTASYFSMGLDVADVNNDGLPDVYTTDMLPDDEFRLKSTTSFEGWDVYQAKVRTGYGHQLMRNMLHRNNGDGTFTELGQLAGVARTDWSWGALIVDLDQDGYKDIFVTNGVQKDVTQQDYVAFLANQETMQSVTKNGRVDFKRLVEALKATPVANYAFHNQGAAREGMAFVDRSAEWGLDTPSFSNGAAYGDLDGDGALDLVVNNANQEAFVYRSNVRALRPAAHWLGVSLAGAAGNRFAVGAKVTVHAGGEQLFQEMQPARGFQSSVDPVLVFGLGARARVDSVTVEWPDGRVTVQRAPAVNRRLALRHADASAPATRPATARVATRAVAPLLADATAAVALPFVHRENPFVDFDRDRLLPRMLSTEGPPMAVGDVNGDGLDDLYFGGAKDQPGQLLVQQRDGRFAAGSPGTFEADAVAEDAGAAFFDADGDGDRDLYVVSGGNEYSEMAPALQDRLYLNDGRGAFRRAPADAIPSETLIGSRVVPGDYDADGDVDLFVGGRAVPWRYGLTPRSMLLRNDGRGRFVDVAPQLAPALAEAGMVTDAVWQDVDGDRRQDLVVVGDWMPITVFRNAGSGRLAPLAVPGLARSHGWWNRIVAADFTGDGRVDFAVGNLGLNSRLQASADEPARMYVKDFLGNGFVSQVLATYSQGKLYPFAMRDEMIRAIPPLKARFLNYDTYARATLGEVLPFDLLSGAVERTAHTFATSLVRNDGDGRFTVVPLPAEAQVAPVYGLLPGDFDRDGALDLLLAGNFDGFKPDIGRMHAGQGLLLRGDGHGNFAPVAAQASGFRVPGQGRDVQRVRTADGSLVVVAQNDAPPLVFRAAAAASAPRVAARTADRRRVAQRD